MKNRKKPKISKVVEYLNNHLRDGNDKTVRYWLEDYLSSSYKLPVNFDDGYLHWNGAVHDYFYYTDYTMQFAHHSNRMIVTLDNENYDKVSISVYKFKRFLRHKFNNGEIIVL